MLAFLSFHFLSAQTTQEEYKFIIKDYKKELVKGTTPTWENYTFELIENMEYGGEGEETVTSFTYTRMLHDSLGLKAIIMTFYHEDEIEIFCIPHPDTDSKTWHTCIQRFNDFWVDRRMFPFFSSAFMKLLHLYEQEEKL